MDSSQRRRRKSERRLSPREVELVLGRAIELQVREAAGDGGDELAEAELFQVGRELGLTDAHVRRALAEIDGGIVPGRDWAARHVGDRHAGASRVIARNAAHVQQELEAHLLQSECMVVERRFPGRTTYVPATGLVAASARALRKLAARQSLLGADRLEVGVQSLAADSCCVAITVDLSRKRRDFLAVGFVGGAAGGTVASVAAVSLVSPPLGVVGLPLLAAGFAASRLAYRGAVAETEQQVGSLLDRLEHRELRRARGRLSVLLS